jgi:hypothetical protein
MGTFRAIQEPFDRLESFWEGARIQRLVGSFLVIVFLFTLAIIEFNRQGWLPYPLSERIPLNHFYAVHTAFNLLLIIEVISLVFALARSVSDSVGKQFEIFSLILLRNSFKEFVNFEEPIRWIHVSQPVYHILSDALGALFIFFLLGVYYRIQKHNPIVKDGEEKSSFISGKKLVSILLLLTFVGIGVYQSGRYILYGTDYNFYSTFYTILIFTDILLVLISIRYCSTYQIVFRNSGFALVTVVIRLALVAPPYYSVVLGIGAMLFALGLTITYNKFEYGLFTPATDNDSKTVR